MTQFSLQSPRIAMNLIVIAGFFQFSHGIQVTARGTLRGIADVNVPTLITLFAYWVRALPFSYLIAFHTSLNVVGVWIGLTAGLTVSALLLTIRFYRKYKLTIFPNKSSANSNYRI